MNDVAVSKIVGRVEKVDFNVNEIMASKKIRNPQYYDTKYAEITLNVNKKSQSKPEDVRFIISKDKALTLLSGISEYLYINK